MNRINIEFLKQQFIETKIKLGIVIYKNGKLIKKIKPNDDNTIMEKYFF